MPFHMLMGMLTPPSTYSTRDVSIPILDIMDEMDDDIFYTQLDSVKKNVQIEKDVSKDTFFSKYRLTDDCLGHGGMSVVKKCIRRRDGKQFAVKIMETDSVSQKVIQQEIDLLQRLQDIKYTIKMIEYFQNSDYTYIILDLCQGGDLFDWLIAESKKKVPMSEKKIAYIFYQIVRGIHLCHKNYITHRDIKPENILFKESNGLDIVVSDFGLSHLGGSLMKSCSGSPNYIAPEVLKKGNSYDSRCDWWSCGATLFVMLSRQYPFASPNLSKLYRRILKGNYNFRSDRWKNVSSEAKDLVTKLLKVDPKERFGYNQIIKHPFMTKHLKMKKRS